MRIHHVLVSATLAGTLLLTACAAPSTEPGVTTAASTSEADDFNPMLTPPNSVTDIIDDYREDCVEHHGATSYAEAPKPEQTDRYGDQLIANQARLSGPWELGRIIDGDTIEAAVDCQTTRIRLIGIDTPETKHPDKPVETFGPEATEYLHKLLGNGPVWLEYDPTQDSTDVYGRHLAYIWTTDAEGRPDMLANYEQITAGLAEEYTYDKPYAYQDQFRDAEREAKAAGAGMWADK